MKHGNTGRPGESLQNTKHLNLSLPTQNGRHFAEDIFKCIFVNENHCIVIKISLKFVPKGPIGLDNDLVRNGRQAIVWTNPDPIQSHNMWH